MPKVDVGDRLSGKQKLEVAGVRPYTFHGMDLEEPREGTEQAYGDCPFCGREGKFSLNVQMGVWRCLVCAAGTDKGGGNLLTFIRLLWEESDKATKDYSELQADRKLLHAETLMYFGVSKSVLTNEWLVPGRSADGKVSNLYRYVRDYKTSRMLLLSTPSLHHGLFGVEMYNKSKEYVYLCEGPWDMLALWEVLRSAKMIDSDDGESAAKLAVTGAESASLLSNISVLAVPGCGTFSEKWLPLFAGKRVALMYDNDHPRDNGGRQVDGAGLAGMKRVATILSKAEQPPLEITFLNWGPGGVDMDSKSGFDVRDLLTSEGLTVGDRVRALERLLRLVQPIPAEWVPGRTASAARNGSPDQELRECRDWATLRNSWQKALKWTEGLDRALAVMLAAVTSTESVGDQLWVKVIGPAACGKSTLCEALSVNKKYVIAKSTIRGFHSGFDSTGRGEEDNSLLALVKNKTLVTKDGDTLLQSPNLPQILSEARDVYDRVSRTHYRNKTSRDYEGVSMTWLLCGTSSLRSIDSSELGERFLDCVIVEDIDEEMEDEVGWRVANRADREMSYVSDGKMETRDGPDMVLCKQLTGGYINHLRENSHELLSKVEFPDAMKRKCTHLAKFVAFMRARPSVKQEEKAEREMSFRLISQHVRLAKCLAVVLNHDTVDETVMAIVTRVALDTARGRTFEIARHLHALPNSSEFGAGGEGMEFKALAILTGEAEEKLRVLTRFLKKIGAIEIFRWKSRGGVKSQPLYRLTERMRKLYEEVHRNA